MHIEILLKNNEIKIYDNVKYLTNASTNIENDWLYIYMPNDIPGRPSIMYPISAIICVAVGKN